MDYIKRSTRDNQIGVLQDVHDAQQVGAHRVYCADVARCLEKIILRLGCQDKSAIVCDVQLAESFEHRLCARLKAGEVVHNNDLACLSLGGEDAAHREASGLARHILLVGARVRSEDYATVPPL